MRTVLVAFVCLVLGVGLGALKWRVGYDRLHYENRIGIILDQARQMPPGGVVVIGDSITEQMRLDTLCGRPALNAGIKWATSSLWLADAQKVIDAAKPSIVILALGTNDKDLTDYRKLIPLADYAVQPANKSVAGIRTVPAPTSTRDGIHPDALGERQWKTNVEQGCPR